mmetsp:Transcript_8881/g.19728  ORF Transcript_8881/g.19728 Transcript_8881/m.19728 type:complete len:201 (+) Transcript_8881:797-1399(+)
MFFGNFGGMILLIIGVLHGPATWPILRICPQGLMDGFRLMKAPAVQVLQCLSNGQPHATANDHQGRSTALLPGFQGIMQTIQNGVGLWQRHGALPHPSPLIDASNFQSRQATLVVGLAHPMLLADPGVSPTWNHWNIAMLQIQWHCWHQRHGLPFSLHHGQGPHQGGRILIPPSQGIPAQQAVHLSSHVPVHGGRSCEDL